MRIYTVEEMIHPGTHTEKLKALIPDPIPNNVGRFFDFIRDHITLVGNGMGVGIRENRSGIRDLMNEYGYEYPIYCGFVEFYEDALLKSHYESKEDQK